MTSLILCWSMRIQYARLQYVQHTDGDKQTMLQQDMLEIWCWRCRQCSLFSAVVAVLSGVWWQHWDQVDSWCCWTVHCASHCRLTGHDSKWTVPQQVSTFVISLLTFSASVYMLTVTLVLFENICSFCFVYFSVKELWPSYQLCLAVIIDIYLDTVSLTFACWLLNTTTNTYRISKTPLQVHSVVWEQWQRVSCQWSNSCLKSLVLSLCLKTMILCITAHLKFVIINSRILKQYTVNLF